MKKKINVGIIGRNFGYKVIFKAIKKIKSFNTIAFCFKKSSNLNTYKHIKIYKNWKKILQDKDINAVIIASPPNTHFNIIKEAIKKNIHIFCEKPVTKSYKEITEICRLLENKKISHFVNFEFPKIAAFKFLKRNILNKIKIKKIIVDWSIKIPNQKRSSWKNIHSKGGGIFFNYICHSLYYLEYLFGKITINKKIYKPKKNPSNLSINFFNSKNNINISLNFKILKFYSNNKSIHCIKILSNKGIYNLISKTESLKDEFILKKNNRIIFKPTKNIDDFRMKPTLENLKIFKKSIIQKKILKPNFYDAKKIHAHINQIIS